ncbi:BrnT family toxin [Treponema parvum]|uniref:BrnT family toxin n=1 Tax=Treponema parvum TaxID=138851 RepID=A0A975IEG1_9SPIR|nr:BrnT family toxin [Treponema parvum]QTQ13906.1 BrnT family toxin [Treponema parvum]
MTVVQGHFEWDSEKDEINIKKHGLSFEQAKDVFNDRFAVESVDKENSSLEETRYKIIGRIKTQIILFIIYTPKNGRQRIISARHANSKERRFYYDELRKNYC